LATPGDSGALLETVHHLLPRSDHMAAHCAERARERFGQTVCAGAYADLYERLCTGAVSGVQPS